MREDEAAIYNYAPYALDCLVEIASFTIASLKLQGTFISVWDGGIAVNTPCTVDFQTGQVIVMGANDCVNEDSLQILEREYVEVDGQTYLVVEKENYQAMIESMELTEDGLDTTGNRILWYV